MKMRNKFLLVGIACIFLIIALSNIEFCGQGILDNGKMGHLYSNTQMCYCSLNWVQVENGGDIMWYCI